MTGRPSVADEEGKDKGPEEGGPGAPVMAAVMPGPRDGPVPTVLPPGAVEHRVRGTIKDGRETVLPGGRAAAPVRRPDDPHAEPEDHAVPPAVEHVDATAGRAEGGAHVVGRAHRRGKQDDAVHAARRQP